MIRAALCAAVLCAAPVVALADARLTQLTDLLRIDGYIEITREEGLADFPALTEDFLGHGPDSVMLAQIEDVYDVAKMREAVRQSMADRLTDAQIDAAILFFGSEIGEDISLVELAARRAMSDPQLEEAARSAWEAAPETDPELAAQIEEIIAVSDLIERNVAGALNSNFRFMQGMADGNGTELSQSDLLAEVWAQEEMIRADTESWLGAYLLLSYQPLEPDDVDTLIAFWSTDVGRALNAALFEGFDGLFEGISYATARIIALRIGSEEL